MQSMLDAQIELPSLHHDSHVSSVVFDRCIINVFDESRNGIVEIVIIIDCVSVLCKSVQNLKTCCD